MRPYRTGATLRSMMAGRFEALRQGMTLSGSPIASSTFRPFATVMNFLAVLLVPALALAAITLLIHAPHAHSMFALVGLAGTTTGTKSGSGDFSGLNDALKQTYSGPFATNIEGEMEVSQVFTDAGDFEPTEGPDGKQVNIGHYISAGGGVSNMLEDDYLPDNIPPVWKQSFITIKQIAALVQLSGRALRRVKEGPAAFASWAEMALPEKAKRVAFHKDRQLVGTGTGIVAQVTTNPPTGTGDAVINAYGISGLEGALNLFLRGDSFRYGPNANGTSLRTGRVDIDSINYGAGTYNTTVAGSAGTATSAAQNDFLFLGGSNVNGAGKEFMGLEGIVDDGTNVTTFQGLTRSSFPDVLYGQVIDSSTYTQGPSVLSENIIDFADSQAWERAGGSRSVLLANRSGQRSFWNSLKGDRVLNDPQGQFTGGKIKDGLKMLLGDRVVIVKAARKVPSSRAYLLDTSVLKRFKVGAGRWDDITGSVWNRVTDGTGQKDAVYAVYIEEEEYASTYPSRCAKLTKLAAA